MLVRALAALVSVSSILIACSGTDSAITPPHDPPLDAGAVVTPDPPDGSVALDDGGVLPDATLDGGGSGDGGLPINPTPGPRLQGDRNVCPGSYKTVAPIHGTNTAFVVTGQDREVAVLLPPASFSGPRPVFIAFNGTGGTGPGLISHAKLADFAARGFIVVAPSSKGNGTLYPVWDALRRPANEAAPNFDLDLFDALIGCFASHFEIDQTRVFVGGFSAGGIFTNRVLQARSNLVAGGIVSSGVFSLTTGTSPTPKNLFVIVSWGGDNDTFGRLNFSEEASLASRHYSTLPTVQQVACRGSNVLHRWLSDLNPWYIDALLTHPKGASKAAVLPVPSSGVNAACTTAPATMTPRPQIACGVTARAGCKAMCQLQADCVGENHTTGTTMSQELGVAGIDTAALSCGGCITKCQNDGVGAANVPVLSCFATAPAVCGEGLAGGMPFLDAINSCCKDRTGASICVDLCNNYGRNAFMNSAFLPSCAPFLL